MQKNGGVWTPEGVETEEQAQWIVPADWHGVRVDRALAWMVQGFSRSYLVRLIEEGMLKINARPVGKPAHKVCQGDVLDITLRSSPQSQAYTPQAMPLEWLYRDAHMGVLFKPAGLVVHPAAGHWSGTLLNGLLAFDDAALHLPRAGIVHRLDKDTSGLMAVARSRVGMDGLVHAMARRDIQRQYWALAHGLWKHSDTPQEVQTRMGRDPRNRLRMAVLPHFSTQGKDSQTTFRCLKQGNQPPLCWLECTLHTGRTHQIRVHAAHLGHPLVADALYGGHRVDSLGSMQRQALHAWRLALHHPVSAKPLEFFYPPPPDMRQTMDALSMLWQTCLPPEREWTRALTGNEVSAG